MTKKIVVASGKGGTGKTSVSISLLNYLRNKNVNVQLVDCDVEEPNDLLFFKEAQLTTKETIYKIVPRIDIDKCTFCRKCSEYCEFNAIVVLPVANFAEVNKSLCHSCGACFHACKHDALIAEQEEIGEVSKFKINNAEILEGRLKIGSAMQTIMIGETKKRSSNDADIIILDAPPGTSCPLVETVYDADYAILVAEASSFGLHDLKIVTEGLKNLNVKYGVLINKSGKYDKLITDFLEENSIDLIGKIPFSKEFMYNYSDASFGLNMPKEIEKSYNEIFESLKILQNQ